MPDPLQKCLRCGGDLQLGYVVDRGAGGYDSQKWFEGEPVIGFLGGIATFKSTPMLVRTYRCIRCGCLEFYAKKTEAEEAQSQAAAGAPAHHRRIWTRFFAGLAYAAAMAYFFSIATQSTYAFSLATVLGIFLIYGGLGIWWLTLWARQKDARRGQYGVGSLLLLMVAVSLFLGMVRWITTQASARMPLPDSLAMFCATAVICFILAFLSIPGVLCMSEAVLWAAVWFVKLPQVRRLLRIKRNVDER